MMFKKPRQTDTHINIDGLVQDCSNSIANALELLQSCTKPWYMLTIPKCPPNSVRRGKKAYSK